MGRHFLPSKNWRSYRGHVQSIPQLPVYTYLYPGLQKVVQAAGRVIRTVKDQGVVYLIDDRFNQPAIRKLLPTWWKVERCGALSFAIK